jgi:hypothetical protein
MSTLRPGDPVRVTQESKSRFNPQPPKVGIGHVYTRGGQHNNSSLYVSVAWEDGNCCNGLLSSFTTVEKINISRM